MKIYAGNCSISEPLSISAITIGNFDGVHLGHREIIRQMLQCAHEMSYPAVVYTFQPHPITLLDPDSAPALINTYHQKRDLLSRLNIDILIEEPFNLSFANYSAQQFVEDILYRTLGVKAIFVGTDFTFGRGGQANIDALSHIAGRYGIAVHGIEPLSIEGIVVSSTKIREFVKAGQIKEANLLLGRDFFIEGSVVHGSHRGRRLGFPTANIAPAQNLIPPTGVYVCWAEIHNQIYPAVTNIGHRMTFEQNSQRWIESHIIDFQGDIYGQTMKLYFVERLRDEMLFPSSEALCLQIEKDIQRAIQMCCHHGCDQISDRSSSSDCFREIGVNLEAVTN